MRPIGFCTRSGIGITPFLSMLAFEETNRDFRRIWLYYVVHDADHAPYDEEIRSSYLKADSFIDYIRWDSGARGRLTAAQVMEDVQLDNFAVMLCGRPEFVSALVRQFHALAVGRHVGPRQQRREPGRAGRFGDHPQVVPQRALRGAHRVVCAASRSEPVTVLAE